MVHHPFDFHTVKHVQIYGEVVQAPGVWASYDVRKEFSGVLQGQRKVQCAQALRRIHHLDYQFKDLIYHSSLFVRSGRVCILLLVSPFVLASSFNGYTKF